MASRNIRVVLLAGTCLVFGAQARAQSVPAAAGADPAAAPAERPLRAGEIIVTAQRREQRLQDVPVSVSVTTGETLAKSGIRDLQDLAVRLPDVKIQSTILTDSLNIRGVGSGYNAGFEQSVATFVDGIYRGRSRATRAALFDIDRVEALKGPQTTFFGANAIAGALNITTRKPSKTFEYNATALYAPTDGEYNVEAGVGGPITDTLRFRVAGRGSGMNGYTHDDLLDKDGPHLRDWMGRVSLQWEPTSNFKSDLRVDGVRLRDTGTYYAETVNCPPDAEYGPARGICARYLAAAGANADTRFNYHTGVQGSYFDYDMEEIGWTNRLTVADHIVTATTGYFHHSLGLLAQNAPVPLTGVGGTNSLQPFSAPEKYHQFSQELRIQSDFGGPFDYMIGGYYSRGNLAAKRYSTFYYGTFGASAAPTYNANSPISRFGELQQIDRTLSVFGSASYKFTDWMTLNVGARYSSVHKEATRTIVLGTAGDIPGDSFVPGPETAQAQLSRALGIVRGDFPDKTRTDNKFMPSANLQFKIGPRLNAYVSYAKGFKAGGFGDSDQIIRFDPEFVNAYEIGFKGSFPGIFYNIAFFRSDYSNLQEASSLVQANGTIIQSISNVAQARSQGIEFGGSWRINRTLSLTTDVAYLDSKYQDYPNGPCTVLQGLQPGCVQDLSGKRRAYAPAFSGNAGATVTLPVREDFDVRVEPSLYFTSKYFQQFTADPLTQQRGYVKYDLRVSTGPSDRRWEFAVIAKNLSDKKTASFRQPLGTSAGSFYLIPERPRSVALQVTIKG